MSYSPLIDFTRSLGVALMFAIYNEKYPEVKDLDRSVYLLNPMSSIKYKNKESKLENIKIHFFKKEINLSNKIKNKYIWDMDKSDFKTTFSLFAMKTNDRMKVQNGVFLCLEKGIIINNNIFICTDDAILIKYIIPKDIVKDLYKTIIKIYPHYQYECLMDPYLFIKDVIKS